VASVQIIQGPDKQRTYRLGDGINTIGRQGRPVELTDGTVSRHHAHVIREDGRWFIEDLGSANGTYVNGVRMTRSQPLNRGDQVRCGSTLLLFTDADEGIPTVDVDEEGNLVDAAIVERLPSNADSMVLPSPEAGAAAIDTLRILYELIRDVGSIFNADMLLRQTLDKTFEVLKGDRAYTILIDEEGKLDLKASRQSSDSGTKDAPISRTIINEVARRQVGVLSTNAMSDKRFASGKSVHDFGIRSAVCAPIKGRERILGVLYVDCSVSEHTYTTEQLRLLTAIGLHTGLALDNLKLYESMVQAERLAAVGETVAFLSHHIKNVLQALVAGADVVETAIGREDIATAEKSWPIVRRGMDRINGVILNMLAFSKEREPLREPVNVNHVLTECVELESSRADERGVAIMRDFDDLPPIGADADGLRQAFLNLIVNALDAVEDHTGVVTVTSEYDSKNRQVVVRVIDNGRGIHQEQVDGIFTPFYSSKGQSGTGLGLAVTKKIVQEHQGRIHLKSMVGQGTTFTIALPAVRGDSGATSVAADFP
jgi:two-component system, NtrC family, sensor kinase